MADTKISALPASTTPLAGTEVLPIVQSGATKQVSVANLTAGRAVSAASVTASTGNFIVGTAGQGIDFSATPGTGTSELLNDYEEGTFTLYDASGTGLVLTNLIGTYTKIGNQVFATFRVTFPITANAGISVLAGLPFANSNGTGELQGGYLNSTTTSAISKVNMGGNQDTIRFINSSNGLVANAVMSGATVTGTMIYTRS